MAEIVPNEKPKREPEVQDLSELVDQTSRTLLDLDQRIQLMRNDLAAMMQQANSHVPSGAGAAWPQSTMGRAQSATGQEPHRESLAGSWAESGVGWPSDPSRNLPAYAAPNPYGIQTQQGAVFDGGAYRQVAPPQQPQQPQQNVVGAFAPVGAQQPSFFGGTHPAVGHQQPNPYAMYAGQGQQVEPQHAASGFGGMGGEPLAGGAQGHFAGGGVGRSARELSQMAPLTREPAGDIVDMGQEFLISLDLPGVKKDDLDIMVTDRSVVVTGQVQQELGEGVVVVSERAPVQYRRTITLPNDIQTSECQAKLKDGVLAITVPKKVPTEGPRHINVAYA